MEQKIKRLSVLQVGDDSKSLQSSPSWKDLQNGPSRVKRLSKVFEEKSKTYSAKTNWWLEEKIARAAKANNHESSESPKPRPSLSRIQGSMSNSPVKLATKLDRIIHELLQKELSYIQALGKGVDYYISGVKQGDEEVPEVLRHQTFRLFGNIEEIFKLHKDSVYPRLLICNGNARIIADTITSFIQNELFYCYIVYSINLKSSEQLINHHGEFFEYLRSTSDDLLGVSSFLIQPVQKLPRYKMFFDEMIKELSRDMPHNKEALAACCIAEKNVQRLLVRLNEALTINDIIETQEFSAPVQMGLVTSMQKDFGVSLDEPMMLLMPKTSSHFPFRSPVRFYLLVLRNLNNSILDQRLQSRQVCEMRDIQSLRVSHQPIVSVESFPLRKVFAVHEDRRRQPAGLSRPLPVHIGHQPQSRVASLVPNLQRQQEGRSRFLVGQHREHLGDEEADQSILRSKTIRRLSVRRRQRTCD